ncbi:hypothetical protein OESDEN_14786, partial [Oesophagostomum dentatum]
LVSLVSHVKILRKQHLLGDVLKDIRYKAPSGHNLTAYILTSSEPSACGLALEAKKEYLLSVSHVKILRKQRLQGDVLKDIRYKVHHIKIYKAPSGFNLTAYILTSSEPSACGLALEAKKEYLLSGSYYDNEFHTSSCFQVVSDEPADNFSGNLMEWKDVSAAFKRKLASFIC